MPHIPILGHRKPSYWQCPSCQLKHESWEQRPHTPTHHCPKLVGLPIPFVALVNPDDDLNPKKQRHKLIVREAYVGGEVGIRYDENRRPISAIHVERDDGSNDCHVYAPTASINAKDYR